MKTAREVTTADIERIETRHQVRDLIAKMGRSRRADVLEARRVLRGFLTDEQVCRLNAWQNAEDEEMADAYLYEMRSILAVWDRVL